MHDLGGVEGFGPVVVEHDEPVFHEPWEGRAFVLAQVGMARGMYGTPTFRHAIERMRPAHYLTASYFEKWLTASATLLVERGALDADALAGAAGGAFPLSGRVLAPALDEPGPDVTTPRFSVGDTVRVRDERPRGHTRCPRYVRGRRGTIVRYDGPSNFDDVEAHSAGKRREPLYAVRFTATELWGAGAATNESVTVDLFDAYLEAA